MQTCDCLSTSQGIEINIRHDDDPAAKCFRTNLIGLLYPSPSWFLGLLQRKCSGGDWPLIDTSRSAGGDLSAFIRQRCPGRKELAQLRYIQGERAKARNSASEGLQRAMALFYKHSQGPCNWVRPRRQSAEPDEGRSRALRLHVQRKSCLGLTNQRGTWRTHSMFFVYASMSWYERTWSPTSFACQRLQRWILNIRGQNCW